MNRSLPPRAAALAALVAVIWGINFVVIDEGLGDIPPTLFAAVRFTLVVVPAIFFVPRPAVPWRDILGVGAFMSLGQFGFLYTAMAVGMPAGLASLVLQAQVGLTVLFAALALREVPTRYQLVGVVVGAAGLVVVGVGLGAGTPVSAFLLTLAAATSWGVGNVISRRAGSAARATSRPTSGLSMTVWSALVVPVPLLGLSLVLDGPHAVGHALAHPTVAAVLSTAYTVYLASLVGYGIWNTLLARYAASAVVPFTMLVPPVGMVTAWLVLGETPNLWETLGGALLLAGVATTTGLTTRIRRGRSARVVASPAVASPAVAGPQPAVSASSPATSR